MDLIREHLIYKDVPLEICMGKLKPQEQYEVIRLLMTSKCLDRVKVCSHGKTNKYVDMLLNELDVKIIKNCSVSQELSLSDPPK